MRAIALVKRTAEEPNGIFDHYVAYQKAKKTITRADSEKQDLPVSERSLKSSKQD